MRFNQIKKSAIMENNRGVRKIFCRSFFYHLFQVFVVGKEGDWLFRQHWNLKDFKGKIIDVGCGTALILKYVHPDVEYVGFDISHEYIISARKMWGDRPRTTFLHGDIKQLAGHPDLKNADVIICAGVLHHLSDEEVEELFEFVKVRLVPGGRFLSHDPCFLMRQGWLHRFFLKMDRGLGVRTEREWKKIIARHFDIWHTDIVTGLIRIPYTHILMQGNKPT